MFEERFTGEGFCGDVGEVSSSGMFDEEDGVRFLGAADHVVAWRRPIWIRWRRGGIWYRR